MCLMVGRTLNLTKLKLPQSHEWALKSFSTSEVNSQGSKSINP